MRTFCLAAAGLALAGCNSGGGGASSATPATDANLAVVATVSADFSGSDTVLVDIEDDFQVSSGQTPRDQSDFTMDAFGDSFYPVGRFNIDTVSRHRLSDPTNPVYTFSTLDDPEEDTGNPQRLVFASPDKAYLLRREKDSIWIVNPGADREADFKIGELDLSAYDDGDGAPEPIDGVIVDGMLFVLMERMVNNNPDVEGVDPFVAVFDVATDSEIDTMTGTGEDGRLGIALPVRNPGAIRHHPDVGILVSAIGDAFGSFAGRDSRFTGGIVKIDPVDFSSELLLDDGPEDGSDSPFGRFDDLAVVDAETAYFSGLEAFANETLFRFNPTTGEVFGAVDGIAEVDISALAVDDDGLLWTGISDAGNPRILLVDDAQEIARTIALSQNPAEIRFATAP